jgi:hypothetical protein
MGVIKIDIGLSLRSRSRSKYCMNAKCENNDYKYDTQSGHISTNINFNMEPKLPKLNNLVGHVSECKGAKDDNKKTEPSSAEQINKQSAEMMEAYLKEGELNLEVVVTYKGFLRIFSAWIIDESLPWTARDAPTLQMLF